MPHRGKSKSNSSLVAILLVIVILVGILGLSGFEYWEPIRFTLALETGSISAETWQSWSVKLNDANGPVVSYVSAHKSFSLPPLAVGGSGTGRLYYAEISIPFKMIGVLPKEGTIGTPSYWYNELEVHASAKVFFQDESHLIGEVTLVPITFHPSDSSGTSKNLRLYVGSHDGIRYVSSNYQVTTAESLDIETYLNSQGLSGIRDYTLYVTVLEVAIIYKVMPFTNVGIGVQTVSTTPSPPVPGDFTMHLPATWTGTYSTAQTWQTQTIYIYGTRTVTVVWTIPSTVVVIKPTTICGTSGICYTYTGVSTVFTGWATTVTVTNVPSPLPSDWCSIPVIGPPICGIIDWVKGSTFGIPNWVILLAVVLIILWLLWKLFTPRIQVGG